LTPPIITGNVDNYAPIGISAANFLRLRTSGNFTISGLIAPVPVSNQAIFICNVGLNQIIFKDNDAGSTAANRFLLGGNKTVQINEGIILIYDKTSLRWRSPANNI